MQTASPDHLIDKVRSETDRVEMLAVSADETRVMGLVLD